MTQQLEMTDCLIETFREVLLHLCNAWVDICAVRPSNLLEKKFFQAVLKNCIIVPKHGLEQGEYGKAQKKMSKLHRCN